MSDEAIHEAGHGVVAAALVSGPVVLSLEERNGRLAGWCEHHVRIDRRSLKGFREELACLLAGHVAVSIANGFDPLERDPVRAALNVLGHEREPRNASDEPDLAAFVDARTWAYDVLESSYGDWLTARQALDVIAPVCLRRAVQALRDNWNEVERLAARLDDEGAVRVR